jgi:hypothetical protein
MRELLLTYRKHRIRALVLRNRRWLAVQDIASLTKRAIPPEAVAFDQPYPAVGRADLAVWLGASHQDFRQWADETWFFKGVGRKPLGDHYWLRVRIPATTLVRLDAQAIASHQTRASYVRKVLDNV